MNVANRNNYTNIFPIAYYLLLYILNVIKLNSVKSNKVRDSVCVRFAHGIDDMHC